MCSCQVWKLYPPVNFRKIYIFFTILCPNSTSNCSFSHLVYSCDVFTHHVPEVCRQFLDLLKLFDLLWVQVLLQFPRRLLVRETAPLNEVMGHLLHHTEKVCVYIWVCERQSMCASVSVVTALVPDKYVWVCRCVSYFSSLCVRGNSHLQHSVHLHVVWVK